MFRLTIFCLCASLSWASFSPNRSLKVFPHKYNGSRVFNGDLATAGQFPWQAGLTVIIDDGQQANMYCGGAIISNDWILTVGHCIDGGTSARVYTGFPPHAHPSEAYIFILHEGYNLNIIANDIGLVRLENSLTFDSNTAAIPVSSQKLTAGTLITVIGAGAISDTDPITSTLRYVDLLTIDNSACAQHYGCEGIRGEIVCAISNTCEIKSPCRGDDGDPAVANGELVGLFSFFSASGCESGAPSGYTRTAPYSSWISEHTGI